MISSTIGEMTSLGGNNPLQHPLVANGAAKPLVGIYGLGTAARLLGLRVVLASVSAAKFGLRSG